MAIKKNRENYGKVLMHRKFLPNLMRGRKTEGEFYPECMIKSFEGEQSFKGKNFLQPAYRHLPGAPSHTRLRKVRGFVVGFTWLRGVRMVKKYSFWNG
jgi:hypothetical protein